MGSASGRDRFSYKQKRKKNQDGDKRKEEDEPSNETEVCMEHGRLFPSVSSCMACAKVCSIRDSFDQPKCFRSEATRDHLHRAIAVVEWHS